MALDQFNPASQHHRPLLVPTNVPHAINDLSGGGVRRNVQCATQLSDQPFVVQPPTALTGRIQRKRATIRTLHHEPIVRSEDRATVQAAKSTKGILAVDDTGHNGLNLFENL